MVISPSIKYSQVRLWVNCKTKLSIGGFIMGMRQNIPSSQTSSGRCYLYVYGLELSLAWRLHLHRRYFHAPAISKSQTKKDKFGHCCLTCKSFNSIQAIIQSRLELRLVFEQRGCASGGSGHTKGLRVPLAVTAVRLGFSL